MGPRGNTRPPVKVAVVGLGSMGRNHARVYSELANANLVAVVDSDKELRNAIGEQFGAYACPNISELKDLKVEAVSIVTPTDLHVETALECISSKLHVLIEKPVASNAEGGRQIIAAAKEHGVKAMVGHIERYNPALQTLKKTIDNEEIISISITRVGPFPPRMSEVGVLVDLAVHDIDIVRWLTNSDIVDVQSQLASSIAKREDIAMIQFRTSNGTMIQINENWLTPFKKRSVEVATKNKYLSANLITKEVTEYYGHQMDGTYSIRHLSVENQEPLKAELGDFLASIENNQEPSITLEEGVRNVEIAQLCRDAAPVIISY
jgi:UDP-N-acetylglucosamine 3-dehydrogenase